MITDPLPLMMGEMPVGRMSVDLETGEFSGKLSKDVIQLVVDSVHLQSFGFYGRVNVGNPYIAQLRFEEFVKTEKLAPIKSCSVTNEHREHIFIQDAERIVCPGIK